MIRAFLAEGLSQGAISETDAHFAEFLASHSGEDGAEVALAAACVSQATSQGHVYLDLAAIAATTLWEGAHAPALSAWQSALHASGTLAHADRPGPLVLEGTRLYLYRFWHYEIAVAEHLRARAQATVAPFDEGVLANALSRWFPRHEETGSIDWQQIAAAIAVIKPLAIISGGPGTGKTTTVLRVLTILAELSAHPLRMALAAPTGKAAARLQDALRTGRTALELSPDIDAQLPREAQTLHRLLGSRPGRTQFRHHRDNPLPLDVLVVDEASMIDIALMAKLLDALAPTTRLIILGDKDQLASVEAGAVLHSICAHVQVGSYSASMVARLHALTGRRVTERATSMILGDHIVSLSRSYRFDAQGGIGALAASALQGDAEATVAALANEKTALQWFPSADHAQMVDVLSDAYVPLLKAAQNAADPHSVLHLARRFAVLCAHREGAFGTFKVNEAIEKNLHQRGLISGYSDWYPGRLVMMNRNDYGLHLFNGEVGVALRNAAGELGVYFPAADGGVKRFATSRLSSCDTAFAMTVHKAQGSEFAVVAFVLPQQKSAILSRELFYTAVTRAARAVQIFGSENVIRATLAQSVTRDSALAARLT